MCRRTRVKTTPRHLILNFEFFLQVIEPVEEQRKSHRGKKIGLGRHEEIVARVKRILRRGLQVRRAVAEDDVVILDHLRELAAKNSLAARTRGEIEVEEGQLQMAGDEIERGNLRHDAVYDAVLQLGVVVVVTAFGVEFKHVRHRAVFLRPRGPRLFRHEAERGVGLRIEINEENFFLMFAREISGEIDGNGRFADPAFHVDERDDGGFGHGEWVNGRTMRGQHKPCPPKGCHAKR